MLIVSGECLAHETMHDPANIIFYWCRHIILCSIICYASGSVCIGVRILEPFHDLRVHPVWRRSSEISGPSNDQMFICIHLTALGALATYDCRAPPWDVSSPSCQDKTYIENKMTWNKRAAIMILETYKVQKIKAQRISKWKHIFPQS